MFSGLFSRLGSLVASIDGGMRATWFQSGVSKVVTRVMFGPDTKNSATGGYVIQGNFLQLKEDAFVRPIGIASGAYLAGNPAAILFGGAPINKLNSSFYSEVIYTNSFGGAASNCTLTGMNNGPAPGIVSQTQVMGWSQNTGVRYVVSIPLSVQPSVLINQKIVLCETVDASGTSRVYVNGVYCGQQASAYPSNNYSGTYLGYGGSTSVSGEILGTHLFNKCHSNEDVYAYSIALLGRGRSGV